MCELYYLLELLDIQLTITKSEIKNYKCCLETRERTNEDEREMLQEKLKSVELEEARLVLKVEKSQERVAADLEAAQEETEMLDQQEKQYLKDYSKLKMATTRTT